MSNEHKSIHEFDVNLICEYYLGVERQGPGSPDATIKALSFTGNLSEDAHIADLGCGTGGQTLVLANNTQCKITGVDLFPAFIEKFNLNAEAAGVNQRVKGVIGDMANLPFNKEELDVIWAEGSIYNIGFQRGLKEWREFIKTGGYVAVTEVAWFTDKRPAEIEDFWMDAYPEIDTIPNKIAQMQNAGYIPVASFILPEECWLEHFYNPQVKTREEFLLKYPGNETVAGFIESEKHEAYLYHKYKEYYGYVFFIGRKL